MDALGTQFGTAASDYVAGRPSYPPLAVAWLLEGATGAVADVGAGTGKLTEQILAQGHDVTAVDPDPGMLTALAEAVPGVTTLTGTAEALPFANASLGALTYGQAWHWVDVPAATAEAARVLVPGGRLGLIWNLRDESVDWVAALGAAMHASKAESMISSQEVEVGQPFGELEEEVWRWDNPVTHEGLRAMARSRSYYITGDAEFRRAVDARVDEVLADLDPQNLLMPYATHAFRTTRP